MPQVELGLVGPVKGLNIEHPMLTIDNSIFQGRSVKYHLE